MNALACTLLAALLCALGQQAEGRMCYACGTNAPNIPRCQTRPGFVDDCANEFTLDCGDRFGVSIDCEDDHALCTVDYRPADGAITRDCYSGHKRRGKEIYVRNGDRYQQNRCDTDYCNADVNGEGIRKNGASGNVAGLLTIVVSAALWLGGAL